MFLSLLTSAGSGTGFNSTYLEEESLEIARDGDRCVAGQVSVNNKTVGEWVCRFSSKLRYDSKETIEKLERGGVECKMCTGDRLEAGVKCWRELGREVDYIVKFSGGRLWKSGKKGLRKFKGTEKGRWAVTGECLDYIDDFSRIDVVGEAQPSDKLKYLQGLKDGVYETVGMVGDGENDEEAVKGADFSASVLGGWGEREGWKEESGGLAYRMLKRATQKNATLLTNIMTEIKRDSLTLSVAEKSALLYDDDLPSSTTSATTNTPAVPSLENKLTSQYTILTPSVAVLPRLFPLISSLNSLSQIQDVQEMVERLLSALDFYICTTYKVKYHKNMWAFGGTIINLAYEIQEMTGKKPLRLTTVNREGSRGILQALVKCLALIYVGRRGVEIEKETATKNIVKVASDNALGKCVLDSDFDNLKKSEVARKVKSGRIYRSRILTNYMYIMGWCQSISLILCNTDVRFNNGVLDSDAFTFIILGCVCYFNAIITGKVDVGLKGMNFEEGAFIVKCCLCELGLNFFAERLERKKTKQKRTRTKEQEKERRNRGVIILGVTALAGLDVCASLRKG
ncbi:hypothetical protein TrVE_jg8007 [Triparma verrucosa]|uniref:Uncharacterized protein n=1 Tax=Triparma verrucosa TaxID=1606542 RepID=A0A9W7B603_9STRA|nr:hypothetical protein TrVE_jg8007 [Triparma verrucosa]